jgi:hypothetical protein
VASQFEADADVDTEVSKAKPARKKSVAKAAGSEDKPKTPRKRAPKKSANTSADIRGDEMDSTEEKVGEITKPTPKKRGPKAKKVEVDGENGMKRENDADGVPKLATPVKKRTPKSKQEPAGVETGLTASNSSKKRATFGEIAENEDVTPSKKSRGTSSKLPTNRAELKDEDKLMLQMKKDGKPWNEIISAYSAMTGLEYGKTTLPNRYYKIMDALIEWKDGDVRLFLPFFESRITNTLQVERMLFLKEKVEADIEEEIAAFKKKAESEMWGKLAKAMAKIGADEYTGGAVEKAYMKEKRDGFRHRSTVATVMANFSSAGGVNSGDGSDAGDEADEADEMQGLKLEEMDTSMDISMDAGASEV